MYIIYHEPTKRSFQYDQRTMQFKQISLSECEWSMRHLLCQDVIFHRITGVNYSVIQRQTSDYIDQQIKQSKYMTMNISQGRDKHVPNRQDSDLQVKVPNEDTEIHQRQHFNDYESIQEEYLRNLTMPDKIKQTYPSEKLGNQDNRQMSQILRETKTDKMCN